MPGKPAQCDCLLMVRRVRLPDGRATPPCALVLARGHLVTTCSVRQSRVWRTRRTRVYDLRTRVVTAGLTDCHTHFLYWALNRALVIDLAALHTRDSVLRHLDKRQRRCRVGQWVVGVGFDPNRAGGWPTARDLDRVVPDAPAVVYTRDVHSAWLNTAAMKQLGIGRDTPEPVGGRIERDADGQPTGILKERALDLVPDPVRDLALRTDNRSVSATQRALLVAAAVARSFGLTAVHSMDDGPSLAHFQRARLTGHLGLRVVHAVQLRDLDSAVALGLRSGFGDEWLRLGGLKIFSDGALGSQTAYMFDDYPGRPGYRGEPVVAGDALREAVRRATMAGWAVWVHAIGDRAVSETIDAIASVKPARGLPVPHRIEHAQCVRPRDARRMARLGIIASVQPCHIPGDIATAERHWPTARRFAFPLRTLVQAGVTLAAGSDVPVETIDPRRSLWAATCRTDDAGQPAGGWFPSQRLTLAEALAAFTTGAARAEGRGPDLFSPGARADFTLWDEDPFDVTSADLRAVPVAGCVIDGRVFLGAALEPLP